MTAPNAVITGGSRGIGAETAALLAEQGVRRIIINGRNAEQGERARAEIAQSRTGRVDHVRRGGCLARAGRG